MSSKTTNLTKSALKISLNLWFCFMKNISSCDLYKMTLLIKVRNNSADEAGKWESYGIAKQSSCGLHFSHFPLFFHNVASSLPIIIPRVGEQVNPLITLKPSITDGVHRNENFVEIIPAFSFFSNFFKKKKEKNYKSHFM